MTIRRVDFCPAYPTMPHLVESEWPFWNVTHDNLDGAYIIMSVEDARTFIGDRSPTVLKSLKCILAGHAPSPPE